MMTRCTQPRLRSSAGRRGPPYRSRSSKGMGGRARLHPANPDGSCGPAAAIVHVSHMRSVIAWREPIRCEFPAASLQVRIWSVINCQHGCQLTSPGTPVGPRIDAEFESPLAISTRAEGRCRSGTAAFCVGAEYLDTTRTRLFPAGSVPPRRSNPGSETRGFKVIKELLSSSIRASDVVARAEGGASPWPRSTTPSDGLRRHAPPGRSGKRDRAPWGRLCQAPVTSPRGGGTPDLSASIDRRRVRDLIASSSLPADCEAAMRARIVSNSNLSRRRRRTELVSRGQ